LSKKKVLELSISDQRCSECYVLQSVEIPFVSRRQEMKFRDYLVAAV
jgi:hypothetical protein